MKHILCCMLLLCSSTVYACDVCSASSGNQSLGLLPQMYKHFAGIQYQHTNFSSVSIPLSDTKPRVHADELYQTVQLWGRYCIGKRWQVFAFVPYKANKYSTSDTTITSQGVGDVSVLVNYTILQTADSSTSKLKHRLQGGAGLKAPTGDFKGITERERSGLPNIQPGTGAWDIPVNVNYTLRHKKTGVNIDASYNMTTVSKDNYKYGNKLNSQLTCFYWLNTGNISILPQLAMGYEYMLHDYDNYSKKWLNEQTGGYIMSGKCGVQLYYRKVGMQIMYSQPIWQKSNGDNITAKNRIDAGVLLLF